MTQPKNTALFSVDEAKQKLNDPQIRFVEVDVDTTLYDQGHIPGAVAWNWTTQLQDTIRRDVVSKEALENLLSQSGIDEKTTLVLYGDNNNWFAAYGYWLLDYYGFPKDRLKLLNGGRKAWERSGGSFTKDLPKATPTRYRLTQPRTNLRAFREDVLRVVDHKNGTPLVDVRSPDEFTGKILAPPGLSETAQRGGHIPGALNVPWSKAVNDADGTYKSPSELEALYQASGAGPNKETIVYCRIGERSSHTWFALTQILGWPAKNYDGSWTEYGNLIRVPIVR